MQTIFKYNNPAFEFGNGVNGIVITESNHNNGSSLGYNLRGRQGYDGNIVLDENLREKKISMKGYIKGTDAQDMLDKLNEFKKSLIKRGSYVVGAFPLLSQELPYLQIIEGTSDIKYEGFFENLGELTNKQNGMVNFLPLNLNFICPNGYGTGQNRRINVALTGNYVSTTTAMFPTNNSNTIVQPGITLDFNADYNNTITLTIGDDTCTFTANVVTGQQVKISTVSNIIGIQKHNTDGSFNSELDFTGVIPRGIRLGGTIFSLSFGASVNADLNVQFEERFI